MAYLDQLRSLLLLAELLEHIVPLGLEVGLPFDFCLVEAVDDGVFAMRDEHALDLVRGTFLGQPLQRNLTRGKMSRKARVRIRSV
jgi:hypothetical protein